ncbi:glycosyltransferase [Desulfomonile tiedjei]|uniref:Glycosyltransferase n=1 Tax=Desulfomonile tiedjei (strain ATCC 49306 / DSM 6799 / DCB-1) TaxID=706587 RepID=I4C0S1_DESTA|nr:glycosyltransferase [Desulfomonile tiedjei]AFM23162.1 glycosyltransferase [Desulfomonile tiedjei DSM 6799]
MDVTEKIVRLEDYEQYIGSKTVDRIFEKAWKLQHKHVAHINSTYYGGGVAELLSSLTLLMNSVGIKTGWRIIQGSPDFFTLTKKIHNALQGDPINLSKRKKDLLEFVIKQNAIRNHLDHDMVIVHDPQPLFMINEYQKHGPWIWRCHVDMSHPNQELWDYFRPTVEKYDAVILSTKDYKQNLKTPQVFMMPAINPFSITNRNFSDEEVEARLKRHNIPTDLPLVVQISRFDRWKDPKGVIEAFKIARKEVDATLVLLGNVATDDPEGPEVYHSLLDNRDDRIIIMSVQDSSLVNALQRRATVVLQKSVREGFGLTVAEAMWKGNPVIGGNAGGIKYQIQDGVNGFLVNSVHEAADRIVQLIKNPKLRERMGQAAHESVREKFLLSRYLEQYLDLFNAFETVYLLHR